MRRKSEGPASLAPGSEARNRLPDTSATFVPDRTAKAKSRAFQFRGQHLVATITPCRSGAWRLEINRRFVGYVASIATAQALIKRLAAGTRRSGLSGIGTRRWGGRP